MSRIWSLRRVPRAPQGAPQPGRHHLDPFSAALCLHLRHHFDLEAIPYAVFDEDRSHLSRAFTAHRFWFNEHLESRWFIIPGMVALMTLVATVTITALSIAHEREEGAFDQLLMTPQPTSLDGGHGGRHRDRPPRHKLVRRAFPGESPPALGDAGPLFERRDRHRSDDLRLCRTQQRAFVGTFLFTVPMVILSGFATPIENMPEPIQPCSSGGSFCKGPTSRFSGLRSGPPAHRPDDARPLGLSRQEVVLLK